MKKTKRLIALFLSLIMIIFSMSMMAYAETAKNSSIIYATGEQLDQIYNLLQNDSYDLKKMLELDSLTVLKESITPVYTLSLSDYAQTQEMNVIPMWKSHSGLSDDGSGNVYVAKTITLDKQFGGNIMFYIENGVAYNMLYTPSEHAPMWSGIANWYPASASYADHASRISTILNETEFVSIYDVKYVFIDSLGAFFYVNNDKYDRFFSIGYIPVASSSSLSDKVDYSIDVRSDLLDIANEYWEWEKNCLKEKAEWEATHPGETWDIVMGDGVSPIVTGCSHIENILDIDTYLNIDAMKESPDIYNDNDIKETGCGSCESSLTFPVVTAVGIIGTAIVLKKPKKRLARKKRR